MSNLEIETLILRFRDLVTPAGGTIKQHQAICQKENNSDGVWWGWWNKASERVPREVFSHLTNKAASGTGLQLLLFDSGHQRLYWATCQQIKWPSQAGVRITSPLKKITPKYYRDERYFAWFRFSKIVEVSGKPESLLQRYSYVEVGSFFESGSSRYERFYGKRIASKEELRQQDRTIWFVRKYREGDPVHEISLLDANRLQPDHFPADFQQTRSTRLLWLSDLHFSVDRHHAFPVTNEQARKTLAHQLEQALGSLGAQELGGLIVSGDLTWKSEPQEYERALESLSYVRSWSKLSDYQIAICPGNHDLKFSTDPSKKEAKVLPNPKSATAAYAQAYERLFYLTPNEYLSTGRRFLLGGVTPVEIVCLNSSWLEQTQGLFQGHGFVGDGQLRHAAKQMGWEVPSEGTSEREHPLRIVVVHHHLLPVTFRDEPAKSSIYSVVLDAEALIRWMVRHRVKVVLHGHMHQPYYSKITRPVYFAEGDEALHSFHVFGMGSSGVEQSHLGEVGKNVFALIDVSRDELSVEYHSIDSRNPSQPLGKRRTISIRD